ncbi:hypothetical protein SAY87_002967 [Trapa incisa]|uniref:NAC domain-containing protein n=1 Tax=Trapa incisa TaxID=236973 RepID=A0AAN7KPM9_9MYRT|nr:hypothetical protein SAY87_002967 [Trapa incisa]
MENKVINKPPGYDFRNKTNSLRLDDWVLCRIYKKGGTHGSVDRGKDDDVIESIGPQPPLMTGGGCHQGLRLQGLPRPVPATTSYAPVFNNGQMFEGMVSSTGTGSSCPSLMPSLPLRSKQPSEGNNSGSIPSLFRQITASPSMGFIDDQTIFRQPPYHLPGFNWYA